MSGVAAAAGVETRALSAVASGGEFGFGPAHSHTFATPATVAASGGSGSYGYAWFATEYAEGLWSFVGQGSASVTVKVGSVFAGDGADIQCQVTDLVTGQVVVSNAVVYHYECTF